MTGTTWLDSRMLALDFETTGTDPDTARIVAAAVVLVGGDQPPVTGTWIVDPGVDIPDEATAIHGITTDRARAEGVTPQAALTDVVNHLVDHLAKGLAVVVFNARYDLTVLDRECARHDVDAPAARLGAELAPVIDPFVIDKHVNRYRRGKRTLPAMCQHYRVRHDGPHEAANDAYAAARLAWRLPRAFPELAATELPVLHQRQTEWAAAQAASLQDYRRRTDPAAIVDGSWPLIPNQRTGEEPPR
ncbi:exonuclease domain-containing protein [Streptomyces sp. NPDC051173]|uniref:exonuclease domain-containing protein n=1 Tax=Streptomyces sp. NPDC051173 TaxID=3155164 RepID=UPI00344E2220